MMLPPFDSQGDLPVGLYPATLTEVVARFGHGTPQRELVTASLLRVYELAQQTGKLLRFIIFGSYVTAKPTPNDVDIVLVMTDDFTGQDYDPSRFPVFEHLRAQQELGVSLFVIRPGFVIGETVETFITHWQRKRDQSRRGIVEVTPERKP